MKWLEPGRVLASHAYQTNNGIVRHLNLQFRTQLGIVTLLGLDHRGVACFGRALRRFIPFRSRNYRREDE